MTENKLLAERIKHERELRQAEAAAFAHERELRAIFDGHERELRKQVEDATARNLDRQAIEYERRLGALNGEQGRIAKILAQSVTRELHDIEIGHQRETVEVLRVQVDKLVTTLNVWRGIVVFLGLPGVVALLWTILAAFSGRTVTGPDGFIP